MNLGEGGSRDSTRQQCASSCLIEGSFALECLTLYDCDRKNPPRHPTSQRYDCPPRLAVHVHKESHLCSVNLYSTQTSATILRLPNSRIEDLMFSRLLITADLGTSVDGHASLPRLCLRNHAIRSTH